MKGAGRYAVLKDPHGASFAILDPENSRPEPAGMPPAGSFSWHELATTDNEAAFAFYSGLFGWDALARHDMGPMGIYLIFGTNGVQRGGMFVKPAENPGPPNWLPYVSIPDCDVAFASATAAGAKGLVPPMTVPGGTRIAQIQDPTGAAVAVHSAGVAAASAAATKTAAAKPKGKTTAKKAAAPRKPSSAKRVAARKKAVTRKPAPKKKVSRKAARKTAVRKPAPKRKAPAKKKSAARRKK
jgi:predicted enzyme related to lactoylglutathione lyase